MVSRPRSVIRWSYGFIFHYYFYLSSRDIFEMHTRGVYHGWVHTMGRLHFYAFNFHCFHFCFGHFFWFHVSCLSNWPLQIIHHFTVVANGSVAFGFWRFSLVFFLFFGLWVSRWSRTIDQLSRRKSYYYHFFSFLNFLIEWIFFWGSPGLIVIIVSRFSSLSTFLERLFIIILD